MDDWTFNGSSTREYTHVYHDYPARMIPQVARKLIRTYGKNAQTLYDPYCGTGSSLVEGIIEGLDVFGTDINPLARLIAEAKTDYSMTIDDISKEISSFRTFIHDSNGNVNIPPIKNMDTWFKKDVVQPLGRIRYYIDEIQDIHIQRFFKIAFSETVRDSSNTRKGEFKLYRYASDKLQTYFPDPYSIMLSKLQRNFKGYIQFNEMISRLESKPKATIIGLNSTSEIPCKEIPENSIDIVVTSPPYGDSHTTVAYGQYSRLSSEWLSLTNGENIDNNLMGGKPLKTIPYLPSETINSIINIMFERNPKRALEVAAFYCDLLSSINNVSKIVKEKGFVCYVVGNRTVNSLLLPTSTAIINFFEFNGFEYVTTHLREIPNKRMPSKNSPTNIAGETSKTMLNEHIVVMKKNKF